FQPSSHAVVELCAACQFGLYRNHISSRHLSGRRRQRLGNEPLLILSLYHSVDQIFLLLDNLVVAVGAEGWFHLFDLTGVSKSDSSSQHEVLCPEDQRPFFTQHIPANTKVILISDIGTILALYFSALNVCHAKCDNSVAFSMCADGDGRCELVVGYTDRVVRAFRWEEPSDSSDGGSVVVFAPQVDSLSVNPGPEGLPELMVSQPGCGYAILLCTWTQQASTESEDDAPATPSSEGPSRDVVLHLTSGRIHNKNVSTHLVGSINKGTLKLMDSSEQLLWSVQVDHQLFALQKLDVTGDGREEVVACAWDGQTYIIDHNRTVVRFQFDENVNAFCAGQYTCKEGKNSPCLVYVSFNQKIYIYWKVELERMESTNLLRVLEERPEFKSQLKALGVGEYTNNSGVVYRKQLQLRSEYHSLNLTKIASVGGFI
ncbi:integrin alpha FG-GAP repeat-containing protein 2, partial [Goodea atripinnis]